MLRNTPATHAFLLLSALAGVGLFQGGCEGTSSGVDNPSVAVSFRDDAGTAARVTGDLNVYAYDQNPAIDPQPLWTVQVRNSALATLTGDDFDRINTAASKVAASKAAAAAKRSAGSLAETDKPIRFNLSFKGQSRTGAVVFDLLYDPSAKAFSNYGDGQVVGIDIRPKALARYQARLARTGLHLDGVNRVYIPGTDFSATLTDSGFAFDGLPEGTFPLRVMAQDGRILEVKETLDTKVSLEYTCDPVPVDSVKPLPIPDPTFSVDAGPRREVPLGSPVTVEAKVIGVDAHDPRLHVLWTFMKDSLSQNAVIKNGATLVPTFGLMSGEGTYAFQLAATVGTTTVYDTLELVAVQPMVARPRVIKPAPLEIVPTGKPYRIQWQMPRKGPVTIQFQKIGSGDWATIVSDFTNLDSIQVYPWTPEPIRSGDTCLIRIVPAPPDTQMAVMEKPFILH